MSASESRPTPPLRMPRAARWPFAAFALLLVCLPLLAPSALAQQLVRDKDYWYVPEHEKYSRSEFFADPSFNSAQVRFTRTTTFRYIRGTRNWALLEFEGGIKAHIPLRLLRLAMYDPAASDPWYEFRRASVFSEDPSTIEARLKGPAAESQTTDSKVPAWKRYKERWSINQGRSGTYNAEGDPGGEPPRRTEKKARNPYPLLDPIGPRIGPAEPQAADEAAPDGRDAAAPPR
jgi:hypothetical protein